jgi:ribosomal protein L44E
MSESLNRNCESCGAVFRVRPNQAARPGWGRFCSRQCKGRGLTGVVRSAKHQMVVGDEAICKTCSGAFAVKPWNLTTGTFECQPCVNARQRRNWRDSPEKHRDALKAWRRRNPTGPLTGESKLRADARRDANKAIRSGQLVRQPCESCGTSNRVQAHHDDYSKPLDVRWMCSECHARHHREERLCLKA